MKRDFNEPGHGRPESLRVSLVSRNAHLLELCREAVRELSLEPCDIVLLASHQVQSVKSDLLIWDTDFTDCSQVARRPASASQQELFLVGRKQLHEFVTNMPLGAGSTLLKPVSKRALQIFLEQAFARLRAMEIPSKEGPPSVDTKGILQCLLMANLKLQEYEQDRTTFLARAVHDFRAPLMAASGYCSILMQQSLGALSTDQINLVGRMQRSLRKLTRMTAAMFQLSVGKQLLRGLDLKESSLDTCVNNTLQEIEALAQDKHISISLKLTDPEGPLCFDQDQIEQVMVNLLDNACKFTPRGGAIEVCGYPVYSEEVTIHRGTRRELHSSSLRFSEGYRVDVSDTGPGILPEHLTDVFEEYTSYGGPEDRSGGGLGLAICKMILTAHGGQIWAENHEGGAKMSFVLPVGSLHARKPIVRADLRIVAKRAVS